MAQFCWDLNIRAGRFSFTDRSKALLSNYSKASASPKFSHNLKSTLGMRDLTEFQFPIATISRSVERNSKMNRPWSKAGFVRADETYCENITGDQVSVRMLHQKTLERIRKAGVIACLRTSSPELALDAARAALDGGLSVLEVTMTTPSAPEIIQILGQEYPSALIGAGTVMTMRDSHNAKNAGAKFLMSPLIVEEVVRVHKDDPAVFIPGALTPTEVLHAYNLGAGAVKLYPVTLVGGVQFVSALRQSLHHIPLIPSHRITLDMVESYISAGAMAVILSDAIFDKSALESKDFGRIKLLAREAASRSSLK